MNLKMRKVSQWVIVALVALSAGIGPVRSAPAQDATPWPTAGWETSTPEEQGIDSAKLAEMFKLIQTGNYNIHGVVIVRHGKLVAEAYRAPHDADTLHHIYSCTKSFTSALIGIAIQQGAIQGVDQRVLDFFPDRTPANLDDARRGMTLANLLTMSGGFDWPGGMLENPIMGQLRASPDWVQFMLDRPLSDAPGSRFVYNSGGSHLLSAILQQTTGQTAEAFAKTNLFAPLGITNWQWWSDPNGISTGGWGLWLTPRDMTKFGYLYLHGGEWDGQQVIPAQWVADSTREQITAGGRWLSDGYGYQWWVDDKGYFMALGYGGQYIVVLPERDMVVTFTSGLPTTSYFVPETLLNDYILPASESTEPLPANPDGNAALQTAIQDLEQPAASAVPALPDVAQQISGKTYAFEDSDLGMTSLDLDFKDNADTATVVIDGVLSLPIGLDSVLRVSEAEGQAMFGTPVAVRGAWTRTGLFKMELHLLGEAENFTFTFNFKDAGLRLLWVENAGGQSGTSNGRPIS